MLRVAIPALLLLGAALLTACDGPRSAAQAPRARVTLAATHPDGVPLHDAEGARAMSGRLPDGAEVEVVRWGARRRWLEVRGAGGRGWISARYLARPAAPPEPAPPEPAAWRSAASCAAATRARRDRGRARIGTWNLRWFPDGSSGGPSEQASDVEWMACVIASLRVDVLAVQEVMLHARGRAAIERLTRRLSALSGGRWESHFDACPRDGRQHVGFLYDAARVEVRGATVLAELNGGRDGCVHHLRPGLALDLRFGGGLDLHAVSVHLDSGVEDHDLRHRRASVAALGPALARLRAARVDDDVLVLGDFNTMGCRACGVARDEEQAELDAWVAGLPLALRRVATDVGCSEHYRGAGTLLDHVLASRAMTELGPDAVAEVSGPCATYGCRLPRGIHPAAHARLSDHCPVVVELRDADLDGG